MKQIITERDVIDFSQLEAETETRQTVKSAAIYVQGLMDQAETPIARSHRFMPWAKARGLIQFRRGEVTVWGGENGGGKSLITGQVALSLCAQDERVCVASFEMKPMRTLARMGRQFTGFAFDDEQILQSPTEKARMLEMYGDFRDWTKGKMWLYDKQGTVKWPNVCAMAKYAARELRCGHIFIDNLGKCVQGEDDYNGQKEFVDQVCAIARDEDVHIHLVHHIKKPASANAKPDKYAFKGTGAITDQPDNVIAVWRNKAKERQSIRTASDPDTVLIVDKQRNGDGWEGEINLWYLPQSQQFVARSDDGAMEFYNPPELA